MKKYLALSLTFALALALALPACSTAPRAEFNPNRPIQDIALTKHESLYAQHDVVLNQESLDEKLSAMNPEFEHKISTARLYQNLQLASFVAELVGLVGCLSSTNAANAIGWCSGTVAMAGAGIFMYQAAAEQRHDVVQSYNKKSAPDIQP